MGRESKKRKKKSKSSVGDTSDENSAHESDHDQPTSEKISEANQVLYGGPVVSSYNDTHPNSASLPKDDIRIDNTKSQSEILVNITQTNHKLDIILSKLCQLDSIEDRLKRLDGTVSSLGSRVDVIEKRTDEFEEALSFFSEKIDKYDQSSSSQLQEKAHLCKDVEKQTEVCNEIKTTLDTLQSSNEELQETVLDLKCRSMKNNLVFTGLWGDGRNENTYALIREFLSRELQINYPIEFGNVHRFGRAARNRPRPIVARFVYFSDLLNVKDNAYRLKGTNYGIHEQYPQEIEDRRRKLYPVMRQYKQSGHRTKLVRDKLFIDGTLYVEHTADGEGNAVRRGHPMDTDTSETMLKRPYGDTERERGQSGVKPSYADIARQRDATQVRSDSGQGAQRNFRRPWEGTDPRQRNSSQPSRDKLSPYARPFFPDGNGPPSIVG